MNNIQQQIDIVSRLPDDVLLMKAQKGDPSIPQWAFVSEIDDRTRMRKNSEASQQAQPKVAQRVVQEGIAALQPMQQPMQQPQGMYAGGTVRMQRGGVLGNMMGDLMNYSGPEMPRSNLIERDFNFLGSEPQPRGAYISDGERVDASVLDPAKIFIDNITRAREMGVPESQLVDSIRSQFGDTAGDQAAQIYSSLNDVQVRPVIDDMTSDAIPLSTIVPEGRRLSDRKTPLGAIARAVSSPFENAPVDFDDTTAVDQIFADAKNAKKPISEEEFLAAGGMPTSMQSDLLAVVSPTNIRLPTKVDEDGEKIDDPSGALVEDASKHLVRPPTKEETDVQTGYFAGLGDVATGIGKFFTLPDGMNGNNTTASTNSNNTAVSTGALLGVSTANASNSGQGGASGDIDTQREDQRNRLIASASTGTGVEDPLTGLTAETQDSVKQQAEGFAQSIASQAGNDSKIDQQMLSTALMYIGAGLMKNDLGGGIENAAKAVTSIREKEADRALQQEYYDTRRAEASRDQAFRLSAADQTSQVRLVNAVEKALNEEGKNVNSDLVSLKATATKGDPAAIEKLRRREAELRAQYAREIGARFGMSNAIIDRYLSALPSAPTSGSLTSGKYSITEVK